MKVKIDLNKLVMLDIDIDIISEQVEVETTSQGMPIYEVESISGLVVYDKEEFIELCLEATQKAYKELIFDVELVFNIRIKTVCNNGLTWELDLQDECYCGILNIGTTTEIDNIASIHVGFVSIVTGKQIGRAHV